MWVDNMVKFIISVMALIFISKISFAEEMINNKRVLFLLKESDESLFSPEAGIQNASRAAFCSARAKTLALSSALSPNQSDTQPWGWTNLSEKESRELSITSNLSKSVQFLVLAFIAEVNRDTMSLDTYGDKKIKDGMKVFDGEFTFVARNFNLDLTTSSYDVLDENKWIDRDCNQYLKLLNLFEGETQLLKNANLNQIYKGLCEGAFKGTNNQLSKYNVDYRGNTEVCIENYFDNRDKRIFK